MVSQLRELRLSESSRLLLGSSVVLGTRFLGVGTLWVADLAIARVYHASGAGVFYLTWTVVTIAAVLAMTGLGEPLVRTVSLMRLRGDNRGIRLTYVGTVFRVTFLAAGITFVAGSFAAWVIGPSLDAASQWLLLFMALSVVPTTVATAHLSLFRAVDRPALGAFLYSVVPPAAMVLAILAGPSNGLAWLGAAYLMGRAAGAVLMVVIWNLHNRSIWTSQDSASARSSRSATKREMQGGPSLLVANLSEYSLAWLDLILVGAILGPAAVGVYAIAARIATGLNLVQESINARTGPVFARLSAGGDHAVARAVGRDLIRRLSLVAVPVALVLAWNANRILGWFGAEFVAGAGSLAILLIGQVSQVALGPARTALVMGHQEGVLARVFLSALILNLFLNMVLIPSLGIEGAAIATAIALWYRNLAVGYYARRMLRAGPASRR